MIFGNRSGDHLEGNEGNDRISGGRGATTSTAAPATTSCAPTPARTGSSAATATTSIHAFGGGKRDYIDCGPGNDTAFVDRRERRRTVNCEAVKNG